MSATNGNISGGCAKGSLPSSKQRSPESLALLDRCLEEGNELLAPPQEKSPVEDDANRDVNDLGDDIDNKSLGSIDFGEEWFDPNTGEDSTYKTTGESEVQFGDPPSEGLRNLMGKTRFDDEDYKLAEGSEQGKKKSKSSEKRKGSGTGIDKKASKASKNTKYDSFKEHFNSNNGWLLKDLEGEQGFPLADQNELVYLGQMVDKSMDLDDYTKKKLLYNLNEKSEGKSFGEVWWSTVMSLSSKAPRKLKQGGYDKNDCPVCKAADRKIVDQRDHNCPYCRSCFDKSGWKQECTLLEDCHGKCLELEGVDM